MKNVYAVILLIFFSFNLDAQLTGISPNTAILGSGTLSTTITGNNIFFDTGSSTGNFRRSNLIMGPIVNKNNGLSFYINNNTVLTSHSIPTAPQALGDYDLKVAVNGPLAYTLPNAFHIVPSTNYISGYVFHDDNDNGIRDAGEQGIHTQEILLLPDSTIHFTNVNGQYFITASNQNYTLKWLPSDTLFSKSPGAPDSINVTVSGAMTGNDFGVKSNTPQYVTSIWCNMPLARCVNIHPVFINFNNMTPLSFDAIVYLVKPSSGVTYSSNNTNPLPSAIHGDTLFWNFSNITPFVQNQIAVYFSTPVAGQQLQFKSAILSMNGSTVEYVSEDTCSANVICSMDPNDKSVKPEGYAGQHYTLLSDTLEYLIRFQNTGNDTAFNVIIRDHLDPQLDFSTFRIVQASHPFSADLTSQGILTVHFNNILLPDSNVNEPLSHGFFIYRINANAGTPPQSVVTNTAFIYFDNNNPVATNTTFNTLVNVIPVSVTEENIVQTKSKVIPNPVIHSAVILFSNPESKINLLYIYSMNGKLIGRDVTQTDHFIFRRENLSGGVYIYNISDEGGNRIASGEILVN